MLSSAIETSRSWNAGLNRIGWGCIATIAFIYALDLDGLMTPNLVEGGELSLPSILSTLLLFLFSGLLGSISITLGSIGLAPKFNIQRRAMIAGKVGRLKNDLICQLYNDALLRFELAAGFRGTLLLTGLALLIFIASSELPLELDFQYPKRLWATVLSMISGIIIMEVSKRLAIETFEAVEAAIHADLDSAKLP